MASLLDSPYYIYDALPIGHIRLLKINYEGDIANPHHLYEDLGVSLVSVALSSAPNFVALSYTWGDASLLDPTDGLIFTKVRRCFPVRCGHKLLLSTRNLRDALRRLRFLERLKHADPETLTMDPVSVKVMLEDVGGKETGFYWVASFCINQEDLQERSSQVAMMGDIYRQACSTIAWLGEEDKYTERAARVIGWLVEQHEASNPDAVVDNMLPSTNSGPLQIDLSEDTDLVAVMTLLARNWFRRLWVLQETVLSKRIVAMFGSIKISMEAFFVAGEYLRKREAIWGHTKRLEALERAGPNLKNLLWGAVANSHNMLVNMGHAREGVKQGILPDLLQIVSVARWCEVSDDRDRIYAILAIVRDFQLGGIPIVVPNYASKPGDVFLQATCAMIQRPNNLHALIWASADYLRNVNDLPSWCPDYSALNQEPLVEWIRRNFWSTKPVTEILDKKILAVNAFRYERLDRVVDSNPNGTKLLSQLVTQASVRYGPAAILNLALQNKKGKSHSPRRRYVSALIPRNGANRCSRSSKIPKIEELWRMLMTDTFAGQCPGPRVAAILLPYLLLLPICDMFTSENSDQANVREEISVLDTVVAELSSHEAQSLPLLPDTKQLRSLLDLAVSRNASPLEFFTFVIANQTLSLKSRAAAMDLEADLEQLLTDYPSAKILHINALRIHNTSQHYASKVRELLDSYIFATLNQRFANRRVFTTELRHHFGMGSSAAVPGDEVWFLHGLSNWPPPGAHVPVILRPLPNGRYSFVGECYIYGVEVDDIPPQEERVANGMERRIEIV